MKDNFIPKLETKNYYIGSFDAYINEAKEILANNESISLEEADNLLKEIPTNTRAAIVSKETGKFVGYIGISKSDGPTQSADLAFQFVRGTSISNFNEIVSEFCNYLKESLNIKQYATFDKGNSSILLPKEYFKGKPTDKQIEIMNNWGFSIPKGLKYPETIYLDDKFVGIIGLTGLNISNKRANLNIYLIPSLPSDVRLELGIDIIDKYLDYAHSYNVHNIASSAGKSSLENQMFNYTSMQKFAEIPYTENNGDELESRILYQHLPRELGEAEYDIKKYGSVVSKIEIGELTPKIKLNDEYTLIRPSSFEKENIDLEHIIDGHILAMQERDKFTIPLGEDKYFLQRGNGKYGIYKSVSNFSYVIVDNYGNYAGYVNILRSEDRHAEVEIGVSPKIQAKGIGRSTLEAFYKELFRIGYASITSCVFSFNTPSIKLHDRVAEFNGIRIESYYANNELWDMSYYTVVNPTIENSKTR